MTMKSIKITVISWFIALFSIIGYGQERQETIWYYDTLSSITEENVDSILPKDESIRFDVIIKPEPVKLTVESEPLEKNQVLQSMLELENEQTDALNQNLSELVNVVKELPYENVRSKLDLLDHYGIDPVKSNKQTKLIWGISLAILFISLIVLGIIAENEKRLYWTNQSRWMTTYIVILIFSTFGIILPTLFCILFVDNYGLISVLKNFF